VLRHQQSVTKYKRFTFRSNRKCHRELCRTGMPGPLVCVAWSAATNTGMLSRLPRNVCLRRDRDELKERLTSVFTILKLMAGSDERPINLKWMRFSPCATVRILKRIRTVAQPGSGRFGIRPRSRLCPTCTASGRHFESVSRGGASVSLISRSSHARARLHSRRTVRSDRFKTAAVSSTLNPAKNRNSISSGHGRSTVMTRPPFEVADIVRAVGPQFRQRYWRS